ncbi:MAG: hypothetical protein AB7G06_00040 [Bdellovibrionales bacterium]
MSDNKANETQTMIAIGIILVIVAVLWYMYQSDIAWLVAQTRLAYMWVASFVTDEFERIRQWLMAVPTDRSLPPQQRLDWEDIVIISALIGDYMRWPTAIVLAWGAWWGFAKTPRRKFRTKFNLATLMQNQAQVWPVIKPIVNFNPALTSSRLPGQPVPLDLPVFAESLSPEEWVAWAKIPFRGGVPDKEAIRQALSLQLGPKWDGAKGLRAHHRALLAAFALKGAQKRKESDDLLGAVAGCWNPKTGLRLSPAVQAQINAVWRDSGVIQPALDEAGKFAFRTTALLGVLRWARERGGVLAPASFLWLRGEDRALWYPLNNLGRRSYHAEAAGAMAHFMAEQSAKRGLPIPRVDNAIPVILDYLEQNASTIPPVIEAIRDNASLKIKPS